MLPVRITLISYFLTILCVLVSMSIDAQQPHPTFINYTSDDGLPSSEVHCAFQDSKGYMWFGTDNGLSRFDGYEFRNYSAAEGLIDPVVFDLMEDQIGRLWVLTMSGQIFIMEENYLNEFWGNSIVRDFSGQSYRSDNFRFNHLWNELYVSFKRLGFLKFDLDVRCHEHIMTNEYAHMFIDSAGIKLASDFNPQNGTVVPYNEFAPIVIITDSTRIKIRRLKINQNSIGTETFISTPIDRIISQTHGVIYFIHNSEIVESFEIENYISDILKIDDNLWTGYQGSKGLVIYDNLKEIKDSRKEGILTGVFVSSIFEDKQHGIWVTTIEDGLYYIPNKEIVVYNSKIGFSDDFIKSISIRSENEIYVCTWREDFHLLNHRENSITQNFSNPKKKGFNYDIYYDSLTTKLLIGSALARVNTKDSEIYDFIDDDNPDGYGLTKFSSNRKNNKLLANSISRLFEIDIYGDSLTSSLYVAEHDARRILDSNYDLLGNAWASRVDGLYKWIDGKIVRPYDLDSILYHRVEAIEFMSDGQIVLGTKGNGVIIGYQKGETEKITTREGLTANNIENIHIDSLDQIWVGTLNGLNRITLTSDGPMVKVYTKKHGLPSNEITKVRSQPGIVWVATNKGLCKLTDESISSSTIVPILSSFHVNGKLINLGSSIDLDHDQKNIQIDFVALDFRAQGDINYRYRLNRLDDWQFTNQTRINLSNLAPEVYTFEVQAQNEDQLWSPSAKLEFTITAPFWEQTWFFLILFGILLLLAYLYYRRRVSKLSKELETQSLLIDLERSALQAQMNPHFIFNVLNSIQSAISQDDNANASLILSKFAKLVRTTLNNTRAETITLEEELRYINSYLHLEKNRFKEKFKYELTCDKLIDSYNILLPPMLTQPFVENAIKHGMRDNNEGLIKIHYHINDADLLVSIFDNGKAIVNTNDTNRKYEPLGVKITNQRLAIINNTSDIDSFFTVNHHKSTDGHHIGKTITLRIKI